jgi:chitodextrinase
MMRSLHATRRMMSKTFILVFNCALLLVSTALFSGFSSVKAADPSPIVVSPVSQTVNASSSFTITVNCTPQQPIKAFELKISFNPSRLQATSVSEGDIFEDYMNLNMTFFSEGIIDNTAGTIVNIYDLIIGDGNVTDAGVLVTITFSAKTISGTSPLTLYDVRMTNETDYIPITVSSGSVTIVGGSTPPPPPPPDTPPEEPDIPPVSDNEPPSTPLEPAGPVYVEVGASYEYTDSASDPEGGQVRLRFDWGDGTLSNWTAFVDSNTTVSASHAWTNVSSYVIRAMAQDTDGSNSDWSDPLTVIVSQQAGLEGIPPVGMFASPGHASTNETLIYDASGSYDADGIIVSYEWNFGDGVTATGERISHLYVAPGQYFVTLKVTDNSGMTYTTSQVISITFAVVAPAESWVDYVKEHSTMLAILGIIVAVLGVLLVFRSRLQDVVLRRGIETTEKRLAHYDNDSVDIDNLVDALFAERKRRPDMPLKETILDAYNDLVIGKIEKNVGFKLPSITIDEVERKVDQRLHDKIGDEVDNL